MSTHSGSTRAGSVHSDSCLLDELCRKNGALPQDPRVRFAVALGVVSDGAGPSKTMHRASSVCRERRLAVPPSPAGGEGVARRGYVHHL